MNIKREDLTGKTFNRLTVVKFEGKKKWSCLCECGNMALVRGDSLKGGNTKSCGCLQREHASTALKDHFKRYRVANGHDEDFQMAEASNLERRLFEPIRKDVMARDLFTCAWCSSVGNSLHVHHILPWKSNPTVRRVRTNLVTLCTGCHKTVHQNKFKGETDAVMSILLEGYAKEMENPCEHL